MKTTALKIKEFRFTGKDGKDVKTDQYIVDFGKYGSIVVNSNFYLDLPIFSETECILVVDSRNNYKLKKVN